MAINVSANSLFHFMQDFKYLKMALNKEFHPRFYKEDIRPFFKYLVYIAMKCFCDIPLSLVSEHISTYGEYAIGLRKKWGIETGLSPITYYNNSSPFIEAIKESYNANIKLINNKSSDDIQETYDLGKVKNAMTQSFLNYKPIYGRMWRNDDWKRDINFYNEREWRYIPPRYLKNNNQKESIVLKNFYTSDQLYSRSPYTNKYKHNMKRNLKLKIENEELKKLNDNMEQKNSINFNYEDINFIIIKSDEEIEELCDFIDKICPQERKSNILKTKIMKYSDIQSNF